MKYVILEKSRVIGFTRNRKGKMERVLPFERDYSNRLRSGARALAVKQAESSIPIELIDVVEESPYKQHLDIDTKRDHIVKKPSKEEYAGLKEAIRSKNWNEAYKIVKDTQSKKK